MALRDQICRRYVVSGKHRTAATSMMMMIETTLQLMMMVMALHRSDIPIPVR